MNLLCTLACRDWSLFDGQVGRGQLPRLGTLFKVIAVVSLRHLDVLLFGLFKFLFPAVLLQLENKLPVIHLLVALLVILLEQVLLKVFIRIRFLNLRMLLDLSQSLHPENE